MLLLFLKWPALTELQGCEQYKRFSMLEMSCLIKSKSKNVYARSKWPYSKAGWEACCHIFLLAASHCLPDLSPRILFSFVCLCSLRAINCTNMDSRAHFQTVSSSRCCTLLHMRKAMEGVMLRNEKKKRERQKFKTCLIHTLGQNGCGERGRDCWSFQKVTKIDRGNPTNLDIEKVWW